MHKILEKTKKLLKEVLESQINLASVVESNQKGRGNIRGHENNNWRRDNFKGENFRGWEGFRGKGHGFDTYSMYTTSQGRSQGYGESKGKGKHQWRLSF